MDLVERLRTGRKLLDFEDGSYLSDGPTKLEVEAADEIERLLAFVDFANLRVHRGPPHGGEGNEKTVLDAIKNHPVAVERCKSQS